MYLRNPELLGAKLVTYICMGAFMGARPSHSLLYQDLHPLLHHSDTGHQPSVLL